jgi:hypothetical protein
MNDAEKWANLEGPAPEGVQELYDALRAALPSRAQAEEMARNVLETLAVQEDGATPEADLPLRFEAWVELSASFVGAGPEERFEALDARDIGFEDWMRCEEHYFQSLKRDVLAGRTTRTDLYARLCGEAVARRKVLPEAPAPEASAARPAPGAPAVAAARTEAATFQKIEQSPAPAPAPAERKSNPLKMTAAPVLLPTAMLADQGKLPFVAAPPVPPQAPIPPGQVKTVPLREGMGATQGPDLTAEANAALPFERTGVGAVPYPSMNVATFAMLCAEVSVHPDQREAILTKYKVPNELSFRALDSAWLARTMADDAVFKEFAERVELYKGHLRSQKK